MGSLSVNMLSAAFTRASPPLAVFFSFVEDSSQLSSFFGSREECLFKSRREKSVYSRASHKMRVQERLIENISKKSVYSRASLQEHLQKERLFFLTQK
jgi:hypothetical protein